MKRIAALTGLAVTALAIPATAMASTGGSTPSHGNPRAVRVTCSVPRDLRPGQVKVHVRPGQWVHIRPQWVHIRPVHIRPLPLGVRCAVKLPHPGPQPCLSGSLTFDMPSWSSRITEVSGLRLSAGQQAIYRGTAYTITSVSGGTFTVDHDGTPVVYHGAAITNGTAYMLCGSGQGR